MKDKKLKKSLTDYVDNNLTYPDLIDEIKANANLKTKPKKENIFMKRKLIISFTSIFILAIALGIGIFAITRNNKPTEAAAPNAIVQVDVNPSVEFVVDKENKVASVYGKNDDGKMIISGEAFIGKTIDDALELLVKIETETGFLVSGNVEASENTITVTVSAEAGEIIANIQSTVENALTKACEKYNIENVIEKVDGYAKAQLITVIKQLDPTYTDEQLQAMSYEELLMVIELYHLEVAELASVKLEEMYNQIKAKEIALSKSEKVLAVVDALDSTYQTIKDSYQKTYQSLVEKKAELETLYYDNFLDATSDYQQALGQLQTLKQEINSLKNQLTNEELNSLEAIEISLNISTKEAEYAVKEKLLTTYEESAELVINANIGILDQLIASMLKVQESLPNEVKTSITEDLAELDSNLNALKTKVFEDFETEYRDDIAKFKEDVKNRKEALKEAISEATA